MKRIVENIVICFCWGSTIALGGGLACILGYLLIKGGPVVGPELIFGDVAPLDAILGRKQVFDGLFPAVVGTLALIMLAVGIAVPVGISAGIYMAEYATGKAKFALSLLFDVLAGLPSVVVGLAGFSLTVMLHSWFPNKLGPCLLLSALALSFLILPYLIRSTQMALVSVPQALRQTAPALGASKIQNILYVLLPNRLPDIVSGIVLAIGRAAEDTAVIMLTGVVVSAGLPRSILEQYEALPFYIYYISSQYADPHELQVGFGAAILLLLICSVLFFCTFMIKQFITVRLVR